MIHLILGDDIEESRREFVRLKEEYKDKGYEVFLLDEVNLLELDKWLYQSNNLFSRKKVFFGENLLSHHQTKTIFQKYDTLDKEIDFIFWEERLEEKLAKKIFKNAKIHSFKLPVTIFKFLDSVYPTNLRLAISYLNKISQTVNENVILYRLQQRIGDLILIKNNLKPEKKLADWQIRKLKTQSRYWYEKKLISFYDALYRIEETTKTGKNYYSIKKSLDILLCYYL